jgi:uncharacterized protein YsxB (DUF464 family)
MIKCIVKEDGKLIKEVTISGHAEFAERGKDIVCAGTSMLTYAIANKCLKINDKFEILEDSKKGMNFKNDGKNGEINLLLETLVEGLEMLQEEYPKNIEVRRK